MSQSVLYMSMSLDGYIAGPNDEVSNPGGDGFDLHAWFSTPDGKFFRPSGPVGELIDEINATGAVLVGRRLAEQTDHWGGDHHGVPIFVVSHRPPGPEVATYPLVTYVTDGIESAVA
jgi:dihydrofolate reductase